MCCGRKSKQGRRGGGGGEFSAFQIVVCVEGGRLLEFLGWVCGVRGGGV
jgi:hypothetical protein